MSSVDFSEYDYFYSALYENYLKQADQEGISEDKRMSMFHIKWEFQAHIVGYALEIDACEQADLNYDETPISLIERWVTSL